MIRHIVMWKFRRDLEETPQQIAAEMKSRLEALNGKIDGLLRAEVGINLKESASSFDAVLTADFPSWEAMEAYKVNPLHVLIRTTLLSKASFFSLETVSANLFIKLTSF